MDWANKAEALASYARQAKDDTLELTAQRIKVRAIDRAGALIKKLPKSKGGRPKITRGTAAPSFLTQKEAAKQAGFSDDQRKDAIRIASIPREKFEREIESKEKPTVARFAAMGVDKQKQKEVFDRIAKESSKPRSPGEASRSIGLSPTCDTSRPAVWLRFRCGRVMLGSRQPYPQAQRC